MLSTLADQAPDPCRPGDGVQGCERGPAGASIDGGRIAATYGAAALSTPFHKFGDVQTSQLRKPGIQDDSAEPTLGFLASS